MSDLKNIEKKVEELTDTVSDVDCAKEIEVRVKIEDISLEIENQGSGFWGGLLGGIAGGALGALGSAVQGVISQKGQIASAVADNATSAVNGVLAKGAGGLSLSNMGSKFTNMCQKFDALSSLQRTTESAQNLINRKLNNLV